MKHGELAKRLEAELIKLGYKLCYMQPHERIELGGDDTAITIYNPVPTSPIEAIDVFKRALRRIIEA